MQSLIDCADQAVILPLAVAVGMLLRLAGWRRGGLAWGVAVAATLGLMLLLKLALIACGWRLLGLPVTSPSGDTASATIVYGGMIGLAAPRWGLPVRLAAALAAALAVAVAFGSSLVVLRIHTMADVLLGGAAGLAGVALLAGLAGEPPRASAWRRRGLLAVAVVAVNLLQHGRHLQAEPVIRGLAVCHAHA